MMMGSAAAFGQADSNRSTDGFIAGITGTILFINYDSEYVKVVTWYYTVYSEVHTEVVSGAMTYGEFNFGCPHYNWGEVWKKVIFVTIEGKTYYCDKLNYTSQDFSLIFPFDFKKGGPEVFPSTGVEHPNVD